MSNLYNKSRILHVSSFPSHDFLIVCQLFQSQMYKYQFRIPFWGVGINSIREVFGYLYNSCDIIVLMDIFYQQVSIVASKVQCWSQSSATCIILSGTLKNSQQGQFLDQFQINFSMFYNKTVWHHQQSELIIQLNALI